MTLLNRAECSALRGIAIIGIFLHNYLHWLSPMVKENEYQYHEHNAERFWFILNNPDQNFIYHLFSFFGHYGVPVFVFLSGYGLYLKYETSQDTVQNKEKGIGIYEFMKKHYKKLFPMMFLGFAIFAMTDWMTPGRHHWTWDAIIEQLTMTINLFPDPDHRIWPGPYWFFGLMMELYLVYRMFLYRRHWAWNIGLIILCMILQAMCFTDPEGDTINRIRYNFIGNMLPFGMGLLCGKISLNNDFKSPFTALFCTIASLIIIVAMSFNFWTWLFIPIFIVTAHIAFIKIFSYVPYLYFCIKGMAWIGSISAAIFVCHPITRKIFIPISRSGDILDGLVIYIVTTILLALLFKKTIAALK